VSASPVPILGGTGALGFGLALRLAAAGVPVRIGSRRPEAAREAAGRVRERLPDADVDGSENAECAAAGPLAILTVPFRAQSETLTNLKGALEPDQILVDCTVPLAAAISGKATRLLGVPQGSAAEQAQEMAPDGVRVVSAFHTASAKLLGDLETELEEDVLVCGDDRDAKHDVARLVERIPGLRPVNAGRLEASRLVEGLTPLIIGINARHKVAAGVRITGLSESKW
jgi:NADPH-dependent F420 reductase